MMILNELDQEAYNRSATIITYCKLFPLIIQDFVTRIDAKKMMDPKNLPLTTDVVVNPGQGVTGTLTLPAAVAGSTVTPGKGKGTGRVIPPYKGDYLLPDDQALKENKKKQQEAGGIAVKGLAGL